MTFAVLNLVSFPGNDPNRHWTQQPGAWGSRGSELLLTENRKVPIQTECSSDVTLHSDLHRTTGFTAGTGGVQPLSKETRLATRSLGARPPAGAQSARPLSPCALPSILQADSEHGLRPQPSPAIFLESEAHGQAFAGLC